MPNRKLSRAEQLAKVPETITRQQYRHLIESVGFDAEDLMSLVFHSDSIEAVVPALNEDGHLYLEADTDNLATHTVSVKVVD